MKWHQAVHQLVLGGARSGKSSHAEALARASRLDVTVIVTGEARDDEMRERIARHRAERPAQWRVVEAPVRLAEALLAAADGERCVIVDCLTLWLSNTLFAAPPGVDGGAPDVTPAEGVASCDDAIFRRERAALFDCLNRVRGPVIFVSNEVGLGIVPADPLSRRFRDEAGRLHRELAARCSVVTFVAAGLPLVLKAPPPPMEPGGGA
ncbi:bifunctional adenosylcobinamide kinase/adenosylcobinamide-phosphate guanylyltransferase [Chitinasiproducens palmae]|uniref:Bifunctional adenosylcobalamin biosynthesis protein n=1 Tax=Chitinasiproducens palmae TaxID=1770053 RepID=A0A1H2PRY7_9BURK|nr:bifunctional adenosylcobinamide kinase/adenosylcobinamide-phosphate guanylyltransferase [Chitinasiproducens palmae]SDV49694.1 adenosylcobinamide kinase /adenosylcobinamide-phosphate guanylyltransferase [Chitinasiproducens palmae]